MLGCFSNFVFFIPRWTQFTYKVFNASECEVIDILTDDCAQIRIIISQILDSCWSHKQNRCKWLKKIRKTNIFGVASACLSVFITFVEVSVCKSRDVTINERWSFSFFLLECKRTCSIVKRICFYKRTKKCLRNSKIVVQYLFHFEDFLFITASCKLLWTNSMLGFNFLLKFSCRCAYFSK